jgi:hypothetical protein
MLGFWIVTPLPEVHLMPSQATNAWFSLGGRTVALNKTSDQSKLRITYQDTLGTKASLSNSCHWRIMVDGNMEVARFSDSDVDGAFGWRMHNGAHMAWVLSLPAGPHSVRIDNLKTTNANECSSGWNTPVGNFLSVEEIQ